MPIIWAISLLQQVWANPVLAPQETPITSVKPKWAQPLSVGSLTLDNRVFLAPMSGVSDLPFRELAHRAGAGLVVSEMVASAALVTGKEEMQLKAMRGNVPLHAVQIAGCEANWMELAAKLARDNGAGLIDINMGCPSRRVTTGYSGSALMRDLNHACELIESVVNAVEVPVTLKMRLGWDENSINAPELARRAEELGVQMITVHGRTRCQFYEGNADWSAVHAVRDATSVPLVVNGDIETKDDIENALSKSGADAVMIGRGSYGAPWLPGQLVNTASADNADNDAIPQAPQDDIAAYITEHYQLILSHYGLVAGVRQARKHLSWYMENLLPQQVSGEDRRKIMTEKDPTRVLQAISLLFPSERPSHSGRIARAA